MERGQPVREFMDLGMDRADKLSALHWFRLRWARFISRQARNPMRPIWQKCNRAKLLHRGSPG